MIKTLTKIWHACIDILFPPICTLCEKNLGGDERASLVCAPCFKALPIKTAFTCPTCRARLAENKKVCHKNMPFYLAAAAPYADERIQKLIWQLKYEKHTAAARPLARILEEHIRLLDIRMDDFVLMPIPLHASKERARGFNQAEILARALARTWSLPLELKALARVKKTAAQAETKNREDRIKNMESAFTVENALVSGKNIVLVDDVFTSGATMEEAVRTIKAAGAKHVVALVAALA